MDTSMLLSYAGELSGLLVSGGLLFAASVAAKQSRKRNRDEDEDENNKKEELSDGEEDSISVEWRELKKLLQSKFQIALIANKNTTDDDKYVRLNFAAKLPASRQANDESQLISALSEAGIKVLGSEDVGVLCVSKSDLGFLSSEEVVRRINVALTAFDAAVSARKTADDKITKNQAAEDVAESLAGDDADEEESVVSSSGRRQRKSVAGSRLKTPASTIKRRKTSSD